MFSLIGPSLSVGVAPASSVLWFDASTAFLLLMIALACSALAVLCAGLFARSGRGPRGFSPPTPGRGGEVPRSSRRLVPARTAGFSG